MPVKTHMLAGSCHEDRKSEKSLRAIWSLVADYDMSELTWSLSGLVLLAMDHVLIVNS